jgi:LPXTG-motif cell wall-anchored protein
MILAAVVVCGTAVVSQAQAPATTASTQTKAFEVIAVDGNHIVVKLPEGTRDMTVPEDFRFTVDGQSLAARELKPGMKGTAAVTTRTTVTPVTVTEIKNGTVMQATGANVLVKTAEGFKNFSQGDLDKRGVKIMRDGRPVELSELHKDDQLTATIITSKPPRILTQKEVSATLAAAPAAGGGAGAGAAPAPAAAAARPAPAAGTSGAAGAAGGGAAPAGGGAAAPRKLPKTGSSWPLVGLVSVLALATGLALTMRRRYVL